jgi:hypothetical protein
MLHAQSGGAPGLIFGTDYRVTYLYRQGFQSQGTYCRYKADNCLTPSGSRSTFGASGMRFLKE